MMSEEMTPNFNLERLPHARTHPANTFSVSISVHDVTITFGLDRVDSVGQHTLTAEGAVFMTVAAATMLRDLLSEVLEKGKNR